jgi:hypothetical protein
MNDQDDRPAIEVIDLGARPPTEAGPGKRSRRLSTPIKAVMFGGLLVAALALVPGTQTPTPTTVTVDLRPPAEATTTTATRATRLVSVVGEERFALIPVAGLDGYFRIEGPVFFNGRYWVAANEALTSMAQVLSSVDGASWEVESDLIGQDATVLIEDLTVFKGRLFVIATSSHSNLVGIDFDETPIAYTSWDGVRWDGRPLDDEPERAYWELEAAAGHDALLVSGYLASAFGEEIVAAIPEDHLGAVGPDRLSAWGSWGSGTLAVTVVAPPGITLFYTEVPLSGRALQWGTRLWRSTDGADWDRPVPRVDDRLWNVDASVVWLEDEGFVARSMDGGMLSSPDGADWQPTLLPGGYYQRWPDGAVSTSDTHLHFWANGESRVIPYPTDMKSPSNGIWMLAGPDHILATVTDFAEQATPMAIRFGELTLDLAENSLVILDGGAELLRLDLHRSTVEPNVVYDPADDSLVFTVESSGPIRIPLGVLAGFWDYPPSRTDFYQTEDGLVWSKSESAVLTNLVVPLGPVDDGFLVGVGGDYGLSEPMTVFRTGPID